MEIIIPRRTNKLNEIKIEDSDKILPWKCSKFEMIGPIKKFEVFIDEKWYELKSIDTHEIRPWIKKQIITKEAQDKCSDSTPQHYEEMAHQYNFQKCYTYMFTEAFPKL